MGGKKQGSLSGYFIMPSLEKKTTYAFLKWFFFFMLTEKYHSAELRSFYVIF